MRQRIMSREHLEALNNILDRVEVTFRGTGKRGPGCGLCKQISDLEEDEGVVISRHALTALFRHAGYDAPEMAYPVPMPERFRQDYLDYLDLTNTRADHYTANEWAYDQLAKHGWDINHPYGQARWKFIDDIRKSIKHLLHFYE